jgi:hypothetical protein
MTKAREVPHVLRNKGMEKGVEALLVELFEMNSHLLQQLSECNAAMLQMTNIITQTVDGSAAMRQAVEKLQGKGDDDELPPTAS